MQPLRLALPGGAFTRLWSVTNHMFFKLVTRKYHIPNYFMDMLHKTMQIGNSFRMNLTKNVQSL